MELENVRNLNIDFVHAYRRFRVDPEFVCPSRNYNGFIYYLKGRQIFEFKDTRIEATEGDLLFLPYDAAYRNLVPDPETEYYEVDFNLYQNGEKVSLLPEPRLIHQPNSLPYHPLMYQLVKNRLAMDMSENYGDFALLCQCIDLLIAQKKAENTPALARIQPSVEYINNHYQENTSIKEIAALSSTCIANLERLFKQHFHVTPGTYRNMVRIKQAKQLLLSGYSIEETAAKVGFYDSFHFSKTFKRLTGMSPGAFAKSGQ